MKMPKISRIYKMPHRRRREGKTDYRLRLKLVKSGKPFAVIRRSVKNVLVQFVEFGLSGDRTLLTVSSKQLLKKGWSGGLGNIPAAYLTGYLAGLKAKKMGISEAVLNIGMQRSTKGGRIYAALKGILDADVSVPHSAEMLPPHDRIVGKHIDGFRNDVDELKKKIGE